jgi:hypothetical protein
MFPLRLSHETTYLHPKPRGENRGGEPVQRSWSGCGAKPATVLNGDELRPMILEFTSDMNELRRVIVFVAIAQHAPGNPQLDTSLTF